MTLNSSLNSLSQMDVSVIIVNYNTKELIRNCIQSIYDKTEGVEYEIIVVDNNSQDGSQEMIKNDFPNVLLIELNENIGFGRANNEGAKIAKGKYLFLLNSDTILLNNSIELFFLYMVENNRSNLIGAIGSLLLDTECNPIHSSGAFPKLIDDLCVVLKSYFDKGARKSEVLGFIEQNREFAVDYVTGADMFISRILFLKFSGFSNDFFMYYEETDLQYRLYQSGYISLIIDGPKIIHLEGYSFSGSPRKSNSRRIQLDISHFVYFKKNANSFEYYLFRFFWIVLRSVSLIDTTYNLQERMKYFKNLFKIV